MLNPSSYYVWAYGETDNREKLSLYAELDYSKDKSGGVYRSLYSGINWKPNTQINLSIGPNYEISDDPTQWVGNFEDTFAASTYNTRYVFGTIKQHTLSLNIRLNWTFTPTLSLQLFMQPFFAVGDYSDFKELAKPSTRDLNMYGQNGSTVSYDKSNDEYTIDPDGSGPASAFTLSNPNFNYKSLRGTAVLRWEVMPGSIFYFVWSHNQANFDDPGNFSLGRDFKNLWSTQGDNILLVKFSYWLDI